MKKQDLIIVGILFAALLAWPFVAKKLFPPPPAQPAKVQQAGETAHPDALPARAAPAAPDAARFPALVPKVQSEDAGRVDAAPIPEPLMPEQKLVMTNARVAVTVSSWGAGIAAVELKDYRQAVDRNSGPVILDFSAFSSLSYIGLPGFSARDDFELERDSATIRAVKTADSGLCFTRTIILEDDFRLKIEDTFTNEGSQPVTLHDHEIQVGQMRMTGETRTMGLAALGIDALPSSAGEGVCYWTDNLVKMFKTEMKERDLAGVPDAINRKEHVPVDWVAAKSKYFVQILAPEGGAGAYRIRAERVMVAGEREDPRKAPKEAVITNVSATALFAEKTLAPGESMTRVLNYYAGPKKYSILKRLGLHQDEVMEFGVFWKPFCKFLLFALNITFDYIPNYGIAIILLTIFIRILFWPLTHKSTESMKKMQALQPLMAELKAKYKDNPKKMQEETLGLYRKHKVNPVSGCLPMLIQLPVFYALFKVLQSAIELRFADFLWVRDLSEPENLLAGSLPSPIDSFNILPIFMAVTMAWQQKLMPQTTADPTQQKMMLWLMPIMMLVMFYKMPSALVLYWSINQVIMIAQLLIQKQRTAMKKTQNAA